MISVWWLLVIVPVSVLAGVFFTALVIAAKYEQD